MTVAAAALHVPGLARPVTTLHGVGPERAAQLARLGIRTIEDLLLYRPRRYEDRQHLVRIAELQVGVPSICHGKVVALGVKWFRHRSKSVFELVLEDGSARLYCRWWNQPFMENYFSAGDQLLVFGKPLQLKPRTIDHPETEVLEGGEENFVHLNRVTPIYPLTEGLPQRWLRSLIWRTLQTFEPHIREPYPWPARESANITGGCNTAVGETLQRGPSVLLSRARAVHLLHFPEAEEQIELARRRLALDEFVELQCRMQLRRRRFESKSRALSCGGDNRLNKPFLATLGFKLTDAQTAVLRELRSDMCGRHPMRRLLQGDVGSGKTVVAACTALMCLESGWNVALMAPTEILAQQHFLNFKTWFSPLEIEVQLITGERTSVDAGLGAGDRTERSRMPREEHEPATPSERTTNSQGTLTIGTHALIHAGFTADRLGLVIIDEQHKFGVSQREQLVRKGNYPHLLVMTATPIPRTLGLTLYGDLDVSTITGLPPGRGRTKTFVRSTAQLPRVWAFIRSQLDQGRQAYVIYPRVEDTGQSEEVKAVTKESTRVQQELGPHSVGLLHGKLSVADKDRVMSAFRNNGLQVLVATSLVEVGMDVPNATVMLIENAERFGLAQLHQMRGRIGRGAHDSFCILVSEAKNNDARQRLQVLEATTDGFAIAEADLRLRGPGELLGYEQSGMPKFRFGDFAQDLGLIEQARRIASRIAEAAPDARPGAAR